MAQVDESRPRTGSAWSRATTLRLGVRAVRRRGGSGSARSPFTAPQIVVPVVLVGVLALLGLASFAAPPAQAATTYPFASCFEAGPTATAPCTASNTPHGAFVTLKGSAVDNSTSATDPAAGDLYVADSGVGRRVVDRFSAAGAFECELANEKGSFPAPQKACSASGNVTSFTATITSGSKLVQEVSTSSGSTGAVGAIVTGEGIPSGAEITALDVAAKTIEISAAATASKTATALAASIAVSLPTGVAVGPNGEVLVADFRNKAVDEFAPNGNFQSQIVATTNATTFTASTVGASDVLTEVSTFSGSVAVGSVVSGPNIPAGATVKSVDPGAGTVELSAAATATVTAASLTATTTFKILNSVAVGPSGEVWVDDTGLDHNVIDRFERSGSTWTYNGQLTAADIAPGETWAVATPGDIAVDGHGNVYVVDSNTGHPRVVVFNSAGLYQSQLSLSGTVPYAVAINPATGELYVGLGASGVAVYHRAAEKEVGGEQKWVVNPTPIGTFGTAAAGCSTGCKAIKLTPSIAVSREARHPLLYIADQSNHAVESFQQEIAPTPLTGAGEDVTATTATLTGSVNPESIPATSTFEYGTEACSLATATCGTATASMSDGEGEAPVPVTAALSELVPNTTYHYWLSASNAEAGEHGAEASFTTPPTAPLVDEAPPTATAIVPGTAAGAVRFCGTINPEHDETSYSFVYGTSGAYGKSTTPATTGLGYGPQQFCREATGLSPATGYDFALVAKNEAGEEATTANYFFTTPPSEAEGNRPVVVTSSATGVGQSTATLSGSINPNGLPTTFYFEVGASTAYGTVIAGSTAAGDQTVSVAAALSALAPGSTYHYRLVAANAAGTSTGVDQTFSTAALAALFVQPSAPALVATPMFPPVTTPVVKRIEAKHKPKTLTRKQKLKRALKKCRAGKRKGKRQVCEKHARKQYGARTQRRKHKRRRKASMGASRRAGK